MDDWVIQLRKGAIELCILALLAERERYGYEIVQELNEPGPVIVAEGTIYPLLKRLSQEGWVISTWHESPSGPPRKYYRLTEKGSVRLYQITAEWRSFAEFVNRMVGGVTDEFPGPTKSAEGGRVSLPAATKPLSVARAGKR
ncbi:MAG: PadR family transcriptional regulator [Armatimonadetes bacterium]|nr:PadR family transcriptional regulator [Armatimonadota bacterium]